MAAFQIMLDRGQLKETGLARRKSGSNEATGRGGGLLFVHHSHVDDERCWRAFVQSGTLQGPEFSSRVTHSSSSSARLLYATLALLPPLLQDLLNYPVVTTGLVMAPRGALDPGCDVHRRTDDGQGRHSPNHWRRLRVECCCLVADDRVRSADGLGQDCVVRSSRRDWAPASSTCRSRPRLSRR